MSMKIGVAGSGGIIPNCLEALQELGDVTFSAICVRAQSREKGMDLAEKYGIEKVYTDYQEMLKEELDFVYIGIINSLHYEYAKTALQHGRNVILEKPFTSTAEQAEELARLAKEKKLFLFEAITTLYLPNYLEIKNNLDRLGDIKLVQCNFSQYSSRYDQYMQGIIQPVFDPGRMGGALYDINVYNVHFVVDLFGCPEKAEYYPNKGHNGVDTSGTLVLKYKDFTAHCSGAKDSSSENFGMIQGTRGYVKVKGEVSICDQVSWHIGGQEECVDKNIFSHRMANEFDAFRTALKDQDYDMCYQKLEESLRVMKVLNFVK